MSNLALISTPNGAEIIGEIVDNDLTFVTLEHPLVIRPIQRGPNDYALDLFPHSLSDPEGKHKFYRSQIVSEAVKIPEPLEKAYRERTSNLVIAQTLSDWEGKLK